MKKIIEKNYFKWIAISSCLFFVFGVLGFFALKLHLAEQKKEQMKMDALEAERRYEDKYRTAMTRIYQNLKLDHFLAAYKNLDSLPEIRRSDSTKIDEYLEVLYRIGNGLLKSQLLKESEAVFLIIREYEGQLTEANQALTRIEAKRRLDNSKLFISQGDLLLSQKRYREALQEFEKAHLELRSIENIYSNELKEGWINLKPKIAETKFYTLLEDAENYINKAEKFLQVKNYSELNQVISRASLTVGRIAFLRPDAPQIAVLRNRLFNIDAEMGYQIPNSTPLWNLSKPEEQNKIEKFFYLKSYELDPIISKDGHVVLGLNYLLDPLAKYFIVRYRIHLSNGRDVFNGHFITPDTTKPSDEVLTTTYLQEIPEDLRKYPVQRMEIKVYNEQDQIVSRVERAFRKPPS